LKSALGTRTREIVEGLNVDRDADGDVVGFDIDRSFPESSTAIGKRGGSEGRIVIVFRARYSA
jgi:hypothetical protein